MRPARAVRTAALRRCAEWIIARQELDGSWGGIQPPWVYSLMALHLLGYGLEHPVIRRGLAGLDRFTIWEDSADGRVRRLEACQSPVWDTVLAMIALSDAGLPADHPALASAARWVLDEEIRGPGDWQARRPGLSPGGWAFEFDNDGYPDIDDTAEVLLALRRLGPAAEPRSAAAAARGIRWLIGMQSRDGGWGAFDADNTRTIVTRLPFCDFGEVIDPPSADVTAHVVEALAAEGLAGTRAVRRGVTWLLRAQEPDGSWFGRWGANYVYGTGAVVPALIAAGVRPGKPPIRRAVGWLREHQNPDGGWGEDLRSYDDPGWAGRGESTASQTAWALLALLAAGEAGEAEDAGRPATRRRTRRPATTACGAASAGWPPTSARTAAGTSRSSPAPGSPATSTSTITSTGSSSRSARSAVTWRVPDEPPADVRGRSRPAERRNAMNRLLVCSPLRLEARAVRRGVGAGGDVRRTGYGPGKSAQQAAVLRSLPFGMLAIAGTGGGLTGDLSPGDLVVGTQVSDGSTVVGCPSAPLLAGELRRAGLRARAGQVATVGKLASGAERERLAGTGALVADLESVPLLAAAADRPAVVVRAVSDTPQRPLGPATLAGGVAALRSLRLAGPGARPVGRGGRAAAGRAGRAAVVLRRGGTGHRDRRARAGQARPAGLRAQADRA